MNEAFNERSRREGRTLLRVSKELRAFLAEAPANDADAQSLLRDCDTLDRVGQWLASTDAVTFSNGFDTAASAPHGWTPDATMNRCTVCGDGPWGRHRFQSDRHPDGHPRESDAMRFEGPYAALLTTIALCALLLWASPYRAHAQTFDAGPFSQQSIADHTSTIVLTLDMSADVAAHLKRAHDQGKLTAGLLCETLKYGSVNGGAIVLKKLFPRERPDHSDNQDSASEHSANAVVAIDTNTHSGWLFVGTLTAAVLVAVLRGDANKHDLVGVLEGATLGGVTHWGVTRIPQCKGVS